MLTEPFTASVEVGVMVPMPTLPPEVIDMRLLLVV